MKSEPKKLIQFDWAIKTLLRRRVNFPILAGFLSELLRTDVIIDSLLESESNKSHSKDKSNRVDVMAQLGNGEKVIIEVQCEREWDFLSRMLYGVSKVVVEHLEEGEPYGGIPRVISVNIVYFDLGEGEDYIYHGTTHFQGIHKKDTLQLSDKEKAHYPAHIKNLCNIFPEYYVLKVSGFDLKIRDTLDEWIYALKEAEVKPEFKAKGIQDAGERLTLLQLSKEERYAYERYMGDVRISKSTLQSSFSDGVFQGRAEGLAKGLAKGLAEGAMKAKESIVHNLYRSKMSLQEIGSLAELSLEEVKKMVENIR
ncbi:MAG: Rpn family recombination-promoting nuclease/putative transposase [Chthoniobacterales bacterium]|nr:Rpn family recombination-promoting nuclease/putative transposase [Chthoniobacterales bacterium]